MLVLKPCSHDPLPCSRDTIDFVKQSAALCLLKLFRSSADVLPPGEFSSRIVHLLNDSHLVGSDSSHRSCGIENAFSPHEGIILEPDLICPWMLPCSFALTSRILQGVVTAASSLIEALSKKWPDDYKGCVSLAISRLSRVRESPIADAESVGGGVIESPR